MKLLHHMRRICLAALACLCGCGSSYSCGPMYGMEVVPVPHDPSVTLQDFSYAPASPIHIGESLTFTATLNKHTDAGWLRVLVGPPETYMLGLYDDGQNADAAEGDGIYSGKLTWTAEAGTVAGIAVQVKLEWADGAKGQTLDAPPLTVLP